MTTILLTDEAKVHGSQWLADLPIHAGSPTAEQLRSVQGVRAPVTIGSFYADDAIVFLADVTGDVETWRVYKAAHTFRIRDVVKVVRAYDVNLIGRQGRVILLRSQPEGVLVQFGATEPDVWLSPDDIVPDAPQPGKVAPAMPLHSTREAMREAGLTDWEMGKGLSAADAIRELARQRDDARRAHAYHVALHNVGPSAHVAACAEKLYPGQGARLFPPGSYDVAPDGSTFIAAET